MKSAKQEAGVKFEVALAELETIVGDMENADLPLEKLIERYEQGMRLVKICGDKLADAEQKVEILTRAKSAAKTPTPEPPAEESEAAAKKLDDDDEVRLF